MCSALFQDVVRRYRQTLATDRRHLFEQYTISQMARKVVGVGSVGTRAWILLLHGPRHEDVLFLQAKEAEASVLERFTKKSAYDNHGARVVAGQRLMQASSDIFLGWQRAQASTGSPRDYYVRQLQDWKGSVDPETAIPEGLKAYAELCGHSLARAHARSGDRIAMAAVPGREAHVREGAPALLRGVRRPERAGLRGVRRGVQERPTPRRRRSLSHGLDDAPEGGVSPSPSLELSFWHDECDGFGAQWDQSPFGRPTTSRCKEPECLPRATRFSMPS